MKNKTEKPILLIPLAIWIIVIPLIVKAKFYANPLIDYPWYSTIPTLSDFFLYYKSMFVTITGVLMIILLSWQISIIRKKDTLINADTKIFIPIIIYIFLAILSSLFSEFSYFCTHGMPDQFETIWNLIAYVTVVFYCYYLISYHDSEKTILWFLFIGAALVGIICVLQYFKIDIYRLIYSGEDYSFTFEEGTVYGPFYNTNYVGFYSLLLLPLFILFVVLYKDWIVKLISLVLTVFLLIAMIGAESSTAVIAFLCVVLFAVLFLLIKYSKKNKILYFPISCIIIGVICAGYVVSPRLSAYLKASNTENTNLENIYTLDDYVEIDYKGQKLYISMQLVGSSMSFDISDQNHLEVAWKSEESDDGYTYYQIADERFDGITVMPALLAQDPDMYGFAVGIDGKEWCFSNQMTDDGTYYYFTEIGTLTKLSQESISDDFEPLAKMSSLASGRGFIWNKSITLLKDYIFLGSGADTFALVFPNDDFVDKYNNKYGSLVITKPHSLYLQIAVQTGVLSLICFLVFYLWYFISSLKLFFKLKIDNTLSIIGFAIMLGTLGYMISGLMNDSTITTAPLYWAMMGIGIGINQRLRTKYN